MNPEEAAGLASVHPYTLTTNRIITRRKEGSISEMLDEKRWLQAKKHKEEREAYSALRELLDGYASRPA